MTIHNCRFLFSFLLLAAGASMLCAQDVRPEAKQLLQSAHQASGLSVPYKMQANVIINPGTPNEKKGSITIYRDHGRSMTDLHVEDYREIKMVLGSKLYVYRSTPYPIPQLGKLADTDHTWDKLADDGDTKLGDVSKKKVQNQQANCFEVKGEQHHRLCFDPEQNTLMESLDQQHAIEFTNYAAQDGHFFPTKITVVLELERQEKPVLLIENIEIHKTEFTDKAFTLPPHPLEFDTCDNLEPAKPLQTPPPDFSESEMRKNGAVSPIVNIYGIVNKDGRLENIKILTSDAELQQTILEALKKWRYTPAMCGATPVASEKEFPVSLFAGMGGDTGQQGRRGR